MPKLILKSGGPGRRVMTWQVSRAPGLSRDYTFTPGVPADVTEDDALWLLDTANTRGRVFDVVGGAPAPQETEASGGRMESGLDTSTPAAAFAAVESVIDRTRQAAGLAGKPAGSPAKPTVTDKPAGDAGQD